MFRIRWEIAHTADEPGRMCLDTCKNLSRSLQVLITAQFWHLWAWGGLFAGLKLANMGACLGLQISIGMQKVAESVVD